MGCMGLKLRKKYNRGTNVELRCKSSVKRASTKQLHQQVELVLRQKNVSLLLRH
jgi:hypothetical protein